MVDVNSPAPVREPPHFYLLPSRCCADAGAERRSPFAQAANRDDKRNRQCCGCNIGQRLNLWTTRLRDWHLAIARELDALRRAVEALDGHVQSHAMTSSTDHTAGAHKVFYSDGSGNLVELGHGLSGQVLTSNGATSAPSWQ
jgi:hypothetical protein